MTTPTCHSASLAGLLNRELKKIAQKNIKLLHLFPLITDSRLTHYFLNDKLLLRPGTTNFQLPPRRF
jgi:hypothetical protein